VDPRQRLARRSGGSLPRAAALGLPHHGRTAATQERNRVAGQSNRGVLTTMDDLLRGLGLILFGVGLTWLLSVVLGRLATRKGLAVWVWDRSGSIGRVLIAVGFGLALLGLSQGGSSS